MDTQVFCIYNLARRVFLSSKVTAADGAGHPLMMLKGLVSSVGVDAKSGLWLSPLTGIPALPRIFPYDLVYLDQDHRVLEMIEVHPGVDFPAYRREVTSAVVLPQNTLQSSLTQRGDQLVVGSKQEVDAILSGCQTTAPAPVNVDSEPANRFPARIQEHTPVMPSGAIAALAPTMMDQVPSSAAESGILVGDFPAGDHTQSTVSAPRQEAVIPAPPPQHLLVSAPLATAKRQSVSITEVVIEHPQASKSLPITGHQGVVEDLFSNWVESPSAAAAWIGQRDLSDDAPPKTSESSQHAAKLISKPVESQVGKTAVPITGEARPGIESAGSVKKADAQVQQMAATSLSNAKKEHAKVAPLGEQSVPPFIAQPAKGTTFTVAQYHMWQVSTPTAVRPVSPPPPEGKVDTVLTENRASAAPKAPVQSSTKSSEHTIAPTAVSPPAKPAQAIVDPAPTEKKLLVPAAKRPQIAERPELKSKPPTPAVENPVPKFWQEPQTQQKAIPVSATKKTQPPVSASAGGLRNEKVAAATAATATPAPFAPMSAVQDRLEKLLTALPAVGIPAQKANVTARIPGGAAVKPKSAVPVQPVSARPEEKNPTARNPVVPAKANSAPAGSAPTKPLPKIESPSHQHNELSMTVPLPGFLKPKAEPKGKLKISLQRVETNGKNGTDTANSFGARFKRWLNPAPASKSDRRRALRRYVPGMVAHYFTGGAPKPYEVADISMTGFYLLTGDRWMPDTMIQMTLEKPCAKGERKQSIVVLSRVVRRGTDGVAAEFVMAESLDHHNRDLKPSHGTDRFTLARFL